jgi:hypothetical protein
MGQSNPFIAGYDQTLTISPPGLLALGPLYRAEWKSS